MPNWCFNTLTIQGPKEQVDYIKAKLNEPFQRQHEQWNMETHQMEIKDYFYNNPVFAFWNIYNPIQDGVSTDTYLQQNDHSKPLAEQMMFKGNNWYDWNVRNWGTKWDVAVRDGEEYPDTELYEESTTVLGYKFNTAWSPPIEAITKLSEQYPTLNFNLSYEEETGWGGEVTLLNGFITTVEEYENKCRDCDALNSLEYCDNDCGEICNVCHYMGEADLDCVAECQDHKVYLDEKHVPDYRLEKA